MEEVLVLVAPIASLLEEEGEGENSDNRAERSAGIDAVLTFSLVPAKSNTCLRSAESMVRREYVGERVRSRLEPETEFLSQDGF